MKYQVVKTTEQWAKIEEMGTYEQDFKNGELWEFNKEIRNKLDMKSITVNHIEPWFSFYGDWNGWKMEVKDNDNS